jgi:hypothetical protein
VSSHGAELITFKRMPKVLENHRTSAQEPLSSRVSERLHVPKGTIAQGCRLSCRNSSPLGKPLSINCLRTEEWFTINVWYQRIS